MRPPDNLSTDDLISALGLRGDTPAGSDLAAVPTEELVRGLGLAAPAASIPDEGRDGLQQARRIAQLYQNRGGEFGVLDEETYRPRPLTAAERLTVQQVAGDDGLMGQLSREERLRLSRLNQAYNAGVGDAARATAAIAYRAMPFELGRFVPGWREFTEHYEEFSPDQGTLEQFRREVASIPAEMMAVGAAFKMLSRSSPIAQKAWRAMPQGVRKKIVAAGQKLAPLATGALQKMARSHPTVARMLGAAMKQGAKGAAVGAGAGAARNLGREDMTLLEELKATGATSAALASVAGILGALSQIPTLQRDVRSFFRSKRGRHIASSLDDLQNVNRLAKELRNVRQAGEANGWTPDLRARADSLYAQLHKMTTGSSPSRPQPTTTGQMEPTGAGPLARRGEINLRFGPAPTGGAGPSPQQAGPSTAPAQPPATQPQGFIYTPQAGGPAVVVEASDFLGTVRTANGRGNAYAIGQGRYAVDTGADILEMDGGELREAGFQAERPPQVAPQRVSGPEGPTRPTPPAEPEVPQAATQEPQAEPAEPVGAGGRMDVGHRPPASKVKIADLDYDTFTEMPDAFQREVMRQWYEATDNKHMAHRMEIGDHLQPVSRPQAYRWAVEQNLALPSRLAKRSEETQKPSTTQASEEQETVTEPQQEPETAPEPPSVDPDRWQQALTEARRIGVEGKEALADKSVLENKVGAKLSDEQWEQWRKRYQAGQQFAIRRQNKAAHDAPKVIGQEDEAYAKDIPLQVRYEVWPIDVLRTSHDVQGRINPLYGQEKQNRFRDMNEGLNSDTIRATLTSPQIRRMMRGVELQVGAPMVAPDSPEVETGNGRTIALKELYDNQPDKAREYRQYLLENAQRWGLDPEQVAQMDRPILVRRRTEELTQQDAEEVARKGNESVTEALSSVEQAATDAARMRPGMLGQMTPLKSGDISYSLRNPFIQEFLDLAGDTKRLVTSDRTGLTDEGIKRVRAATIARVYYDEGHNLSREDRNALTALVETSGESESLKNPVSAMMGAAPLIGRVRAKVDTGNLQVDADPTPYIREAIRLLRAGRETAERGGNSLLVGVRTELGQQKLFGGESWSEPGRRLALFMAAHNRSAKTITQMLRNLGRKLLNPALAAQQSTFFDEDAAADMDLFVERAAEDATGENMEDLFAETDAETQTKAAPPKTKGETSEPESGNLTATEPSGGASDGREGQLGRAERGGEAVSDTARAGQPDNGRQHADRHAIRGGDQGLQTGRETVTEPRRGRRYEQVVEVRPDKTVTPERDIIGESFPQIAETLYPHQRDGVNLALAAMQDDPGGFFLADGTGAGKTMQELAVAHHVAQKTGKPALIFTENKRIIRDSFAKDAELLGIDFHTYDGETKLRPGITIATYHALSRAGNPFVADIRGEDLGALIFDESHNLKNWEKSRKAKVGLQLADTAPAVMFATATPLDNPPQLKYLRRTGVYQRESQFLDLMRALGYEQRTAKRGRNQVTYWTRTEGTTEDEVHARMADVFGELTEKGRMVKREVPLDGLEAGFRTVRLPDAAYDELQVIDRHYMDRAGTNPMMLGRMKAQSLLARRRFVENYKVDATLEEVDKELKAGRQVVVFAERINPTEVTGKRYRGPGQEPEQVLIASSRGTIKHLEEKLAERYGEESFGQVYGGKDARSKEAIADFQAGRKKILIATPKSGGTGVNFDDVTGDAPRTMIIMSPPFSAMDAVQMVGRINRVTTQSDTRTVWMFSDSRVEHRNKQIIASKLAALGGAVKGDVRKLDISRYEEISDAAMQEMLGEMDVGRADGDGVMAAPREAADWPERKIPWAGTQASAANNRDITKMLEDRLGIPIRTGGIFDKQAAGTYNPLEELVRSRDAYDLPTIAHEFGHHLDNIFAWRDHLTGPQAQELGALGQEIYPSYKWRKLWKEGIAQFTKLYVWDHEEAKHRAPEFYKTFTSTMKINPEIAETVEVFHKMVQSLLSMDPVDKIAAHIEDGKPEKKASGIKETVRSVFNKGVELFYDEWRVLDEFEKQMTPAPAVSKSPLQTAYLMSGHQGRAEQWLLKGGRGQIRYADWEPVGKPLGEILAPVADQLDEWNTYVAAKHSLTWLRRGLDVPWTEGDARETVERLKNDTFEQVHTEFSEFMRNLAQYWEDAGGLPQGTVAKWEQMYPDYVPFFRAMDAIEVLEEGTRSKRPYKRARGSNRPIINPVVSAIRQVYRTTFAAEKNRVLRNVVELARQTPGSGKWVARIAKTVKPTRGRLKEIASALEQQGLTLEDHELEYTFTLWRASQSRPKPNTVGVWQAGRLNYYEMDPALVNTLQHLDGPEQSIGLQIAKTIGVPTRTLKAGVVLALDFMGRNIVRDAFMGYALNDYPQMLGLPTIAGFFKSIGHTKLYHEFMAAGAAYATWISPDIIDRPEISVRKVTGKKTVATVASHPLRAVQLFGEAFESATRVGTFGAAAKHSDVTGAIDRLMLAGRQAQEASVNFSRMGTVTRYINMVIPFFNPAIQGVVRSALNTLGYYNVPRFGGGGGAEGGGPPEPPRGASGARLPAPGGGGKRWSWRKLFKVLLRAGSVITMFSFLCYLLNRRTPAYWEIPARDRDLYWHVPLEAFGGPAGYFLQIPKPFELGVLFGSVPERVFRYIDTQDPESFDELGEGLWNILAPGAMPTIAAPWLENWGNRSFFWNTPIVPTHLEDTEDWMQWRPSTSELAKALGKRLNYSPAKLENVVRGYGGGVGIAGLRFADWTLQSLHIIPRDPNTGEFVPRDPKTWPGVKSFVRSAFRYAGSVDAFYNELEKSRKVYNTWRQLDRREQAEYRAGHHEELRQFERLQRHVERINTWRERRRRVDNSDLPDARKRRALRMWNLRILNECRRALGREPLETEKYMGAE